MSDRNATAEEVHAEYHEGLMRDCTNEQCRAYMGESFSQPSPEPRTAVRIKVYGGQLGLLPPGSVWRVEQTTEHIEPGGLIGEVMPEWTLIDLAPIEAEAAAGSARICPDCHEPIIGAAHWHEAAAGSGSLCPAGCGCRLGTEDADRDECACDGPCTQPAGSGSLDVLHTHDLRIGAREYEDGTVRAWQVYCVICDQAGRIVLPDKERAALAAGSPEGES